MGKSDTIRSIVEESGPDLYFDTKYPLDTPQKYKQSTTMLIESNEHDHANNA